MQLTFLFIGIISLLVLLYVIKLLIENLRLKEITVFELTEKQKDFEIVKTGIHSICIIGLSSDFKVSELQANISTPNGEQIKLTENTIRYSSLRKGVKIFEQWKFTTHQHGTHTLNLTNLEEFLSKNPLLTSQKVFSNRQIETKSLKVLIKQSVSTKDRLIMILGFVFGINGLFWGVTIAINPTIFE
jgi:hypothetical protein